MVVGSSSSEPESWQVFINFRGEELRKSFVSHLEGALDRAQIKYYIDSKETPGQKLSILYERIKQSEIALPIFSSKYAESDWCLDELVVIMEQVNNGNLKIIPIFFNVRTDEVKEQQGEFGCKLYAEGKSKRPNIRNWETALRAVPSTIGLSSSNFRDEKELVDKIIESVKRVLDTIPPVSASSSRTHVDISSVNTSSSSGEYGMDQRLEQLEEKIDFKCAETQIIGIVGMPGIGKTTLAEKHFKDCNDKFVFNEIYRDVTKESEEYGSHFWLKDKLLNGQENAQVKLFKKKIFVVLDDVSDKKQVEFLLQHIDWIKKGSKIVITTRDKSSISELVHDTYVVPGLDDKDASQLFKDHAFKDQVSRDKKGKGQVSSTTENFQKLTKMFVDYAQGNPGALVELGKELCGKDEAHWERRLDSLPHCCNPKIRTELKISYKKLTDQQKDAFLDIACFFTSEEEDYVKCLLDPCGEEAVRDLVEKFFISVSAGRIEMHNLLRTFGRELGASNENNFGKRLWNHDTIAETLLSETDVPNPENKKETTKVRGILLDTSKLTKGIPVDKRTFIEKFNQTNLRYLKIYDSICPKSHCNVNLPDELDFPFQEMRYLHWLKFPLDELPSDFDPNNLIDLRLPYSDDIKRVWEAAKDVPHLKWVDLSYSTKLNDLSALSNAFHLRRLNLEGCSILEKLPEDMKNMKSLVLLNLRDCKKLSSLPENLNLISLKTLILSGCKIFNKFELISENLEFLHLDGTAIERLPPTIQNFHKLILLNLKNCKELDVLPDGLYKLKALEELILSGCFKLRSFPEIKEKMENLQILLLDGTSIKEVPKLFSHLSNLNVQAALQQPLQVNGLSMLRRLCLSGNDMIYSLQSSICQLHHLKWIDLRYCKNLTSLSMLPPNLQYLNAHACTSLKTVASPRALLMPTEQVSSSFIFTNCEKLEHVAKNELICYALYKSQLLSDALNRHNKGLAFENLVATCFPGSEVPAWFNHKASGSMLELELSRYLRDNGFVGIALCAIVSFQKYNIQNNNFMVKCISKFNKVETSSSLFNFHIGDLSETKEDLRMIKSTHVFIGFTSWWNMKQCQDVGSKKGCDPPGLKKKCGGPINATIHFEVTDGTCEAANCEVLKCGFSLVCESDHDSWDGNVDEIPVVSESSGVKADASSVNSQSDNNPLDANVDASPMQEKVRLGVMSQFLGLLRKRGWFFTL